MKYESLGKQVLCNNVHFADGATNEAAQAIANAMNAVDYDTAPTDPNQLTLDVDNVPFQTCGKRQEGDEFVCSHGCGLRWGIDETKPGCPNLGNRS